MKKFFVLFAVFVTMFLAVPAMAQGPDATPVATPSDDDVNRLAKNMYCPVCENIPLDSCETKACKDWREEIRLKLSEGWTDEQIYDWFVEQHGDRVLASPPARGLNWLVYVVPPLAFVIGIFFVFRLLSRSMTARTAPAGDTPEKPSSAGDPDMISRLEKELKDRE